MGPCGNGVKCEHANQLSLGFLLVTWVTIYFCIILREAQSKRVLLRKLHILQSPMDSDVFIQVPSKYTMLFTKIICLDDSNRIIEAVKIISSAI